MTIITSCKRGHDLRVEGAIEVRGTNTWRCVECRRIDDREQKRVKAKARVLPTCCSKGHKYTEENTRWVARGQYRHRQCLLCVKISEGNRSARKKSGAPAGKAMAFNLYRTREILDFDRRIENEPCAWRKAEIREEKAALMRAQ